MPPKFERRHYRSIAETMRDTQPVANTPEHQVWWYILTALAQDFRRDNPRFDWNRFFTAATMKV
jgi:hypothetical protein